MAATDMITEKQESDGARGADGHVVRVCLSVQSTRVRQSSAAAVVDKGDGRCDGASKRAKEA